MLSSKNKKILPQGTQIIKHANLCDLAYPDTNLNASLHIDDTIIDVLVCAVCGEIYCAECFDSINISKDTNHESIPPTEVPITDVVESMKNTTNTSNTSTTNHAKCTQLFCALFDISAKELIDASQAFCGHYSHNDDQDECFVCHETSCINCRVEYLARFYCNNCFKRCLFCAKPTEISKAQHDIKVPEYTRKKIQFLQNSICAKCGLPACDDCLDYDFLCPGCSGEQSG